MLISAHQPPYELRYNQVSPKPIPLHVSFTYYLTIQVESMFLSAISGLSFEADRLEELIKSGTSIFDILPSFFYHKNRLVRVAALEVRVWSQCPHSIPSMWSHSMMYQYCQVYVRRSYTAYDVTCVQHEMLDENTTIVQWQFLLLSPIPTGGTSSPHLPPP